MGRGKDWGGGGVNWTKNKGGQGHVLRQYTGDLCHCFNFYLIMLLSFNLL